MQSFSQYTVRMNLDKAGFDQKLGQSEKKLNQFQSRLSRIGLGRLGPFAILAAGVKTFMDGLDHIRNNDAFTEQERRAKNMVDSWDGNMENMKSGWGKFSGAVASGAISFFQNVGGMIKATGAMLSGGDLKQAVIDHRTMNEEAGKAVRYAREMEEINNRIEKQKSERLQMEKEIAAIQQRQVDFQFSQQTNVEQLIALTDEQYAIGQEIITLNKQSLDTTSKRLELERTKLAIMQTLARVEADEARKRDEDAKDATRIEELKIRNAEQLQAARESLGAAEREFSFNQLRDADKLEDIQKRINDLKEIANDETLDGIEAQREIMRLNQQSLDIESRRNDELSRAKQGYAEIRQSIAGIEAEIRKAQSGIDTFSLEDAAAGRAGTGRGQRDARRVMDLEGRQDQDRDKLARALERGDTDRVTELTKRMEERQSRAMGLRKSIVGLDATDKDPIAALQSQLDIQRKSLEELIKIRQEL